MLQKKSLFLGVVLASLWSHTALATSTVECDEVGGSKVEIRYNVGYGAPNWLQAVPPSGEILRTGYEEKNQIPYYWADENGTRLEVRNEVGERLMKLETIRKGDIEVGIATFGADQHVPVLCLQIG